MLEELKQGCYEANMLLPQYQLVELTFGNVSAIERSQGIVAIKPSGVAFQQLTPDKIVLIDLDGIKVEGELKPSSDTPTHLRLYQAFENIGGIAHTHSRFATSFAQAGKPIECYGTTHADYFNGPIPLTRKLTPGETAGQYEVETGNVIIERFAKLNPHEYPGVLVQNHGAFAWGPTAAKAVENACLTEIIAQLAYYTLQVNPQVQAIEQHLLDKHFLRKHGENSYYGQQ